MTSVLSDHQNLGSQSDLDHYFCDRDPDHDQWLWSAIRSAVIDDPEKIIRKEYFAQSKFFSSFFAFETLKSGLIFAWKWLKWTIRPWQKKILNQSNLSNHSSNCKMIGDP